MAHEIQQNDGLVLAQKTAWHGLGKVVESAPNPFAALRIAGLEWTVLESESMTGVFEAGTTNEKRVVSNESKMLIRDDDYSVLGIVGREYRPLQNSTMAELAWTFRKAGDDVGVEVESAGSIRGGRRTWMLLRAPSIDMTGRGDMAQPYLMLANAHDGTMAFQAFPTNVRVVCSNTFHAALHGTRKAFAFRHTLGIDMRVDKIKEDIDHWFAAIDQGRIRAKEMSVKQVNRETVRNLWTDVITVLDGAIPQDPKDGWEQRRKDRAVGFLAHCAATFDQEGSSLGYNLWTAANAATSAIQHYRAELSLRSGRKDQQALQYAAWDGPTADFTAKAFDIAMQAV